MLALGGRVVKNVAGYDVVRLVVGSRGTLGFITAAHVRLRPLPARDTTLLLADSREALVALAAAIEPLGPAALELFSPGLTRNGTAAQDHWTLAVRLRGNADSVADANARLLAFAGGFRPLDGAAGHRFWDRLADAEAAADRLVRVAAPPASLERSLDSALRIAAASWPAGWHAAAHAADGIVRVWPDRTGPQSQAAASGAVLATAVTAERSALAHLAGTVHIPIAADLPAGFDRWAIRPAALRIMSGLRQTFDPAGILSAGRFPA
jgi:glycolate oxidase FAD binding subunit